MMQEKKVKTIVISSIMFEITEVPLLFTNVTFNKYQKIIYGHKVFVE